MVAWELVGRKNAAMLPSVRPREALQLPRGGEGQGILWRPPAYSLLVYSFLSAENIGKPWPPRIPLGNSQRSPAPLAGGMGSLSSLQEPQPRCAFGLYFWALFSCLPNNLHSPSD